MKVQEVFSPHFPRVVVDRSEWVRSGLCDDDDGEVTLARSFCNPTTELKMKLLTMWCGVVLVAVNSDKQSHT